MEYAPSTSAKYLQQVMPIYLDAMAESEAPDLNQCAVYGVGVVARNFPAEMAPLLPQVVSLCMLTVFSQHELLHVMAIATNNCHQLLHRRVEPVPADLWTRCWKGRWP